MHSKIAVKSRNKNMSVTDTFKNKFLTILIAILVTIEVSPIMREIGGRIGLIMSALLVVAIPLAGIYAFSGRRKVFAVLIVIGVQTVLFTA